MSGVKKVSSAAGDYYLVTQKVKIIRKDKSYLEGDNPEDHNLKIGSSMGPTGRPLTGLSIVEEELLLPKIIRMKPTSEHWEESVELYGHNISRKVPNAGLPLDISMKFKNEADAEKYLKRFDKIKMDVTNPKYQEESIAALTNMCNGLPLHTADYILWRYCLVYSRVANEPELKNKSKKIVFFIHDADRAKSKNIVASKARALAMERYLKVIKNSEASNQVMLLFGLLPEFFDESEVMLQLEKKALEQPEKFVLFTNKDYDGETISFIRNCINIGILEEVPNTEIIKQVAGDQKVLGNDVVAAAKFLKTAEGKKFRDLLNAQVAAETKY